MKKIFLNLTLLLLSVIVIASGCATIMNGPKKIVDIDSEPSKAKIIITDKRGDTVYSGLTPATAWLNRGAGYFAKAKYKISVSKPGYQSQTQTLKTGLNGLYLGNLLLGGVIGMLIVDPMSGAMWTFPQSDLKVTLSKETSQVNPVIKIIDINSIDTAMRRELVRVK
jgi:hypothetical protein